MEQGYSYANAVVAKYILVAIDNSKVSLNIHLRQIMS